MHQATYDEHGPAIREAVAMLPEKKQPKLHINRNIPEGYVDHQEKGRVVRYRADDYVAMLRSRAERLDPQAGRADL